jgi:hypothetical protein
VADSPQHKHNENGAIKQSTVVQKTTTIVYGHQLCTCGVTVATYVVSRTVS